MIQKKMSFSNTYNLYLLVTKSILTKKVSLNFSFHLNRKNRTKLRFCKGHLLNVTNAFQFKFCKNLLKYCSLKVQDICSFKWLYHFGFKYSSVLQFLAHFKRYFIPYFAFILLSTSDPKCKSQVWLWNYPTMAELKGILRLSIVMTICKCWIITKIDYV